MPLANDPQARNDRLPVSCELGNPTAVPVCLPFEKPDQPGATPRQRDDGERKEHSGCG